MSENERMWRLGFMSGVYDRAGGSDAEPVDARQVAESLGSDLNAAAQNLILRLQGEGLLRIVSMANGVVRLTSEGAREVEAARASPTGLAEHPESADAAYDVEPDATGAVRPLAVVDRSTLLKLEEFVRALREALNGLDLEGRLGLGDEDQSELAAEIHTIEAQIASPKPKARILELSLVSVEGLLENATDDETAVEILDTIDALVRDLS